jgi:hypothetical protein
MSALRRRAQAVKLAWQNSVARLYYRVLSELQLVRRWIPTDELAVAGADFQELFKKRWGDGGSFRCAIVDGGEDDVVFNSATYNCAGQREVNVFARRFTRSPRNWLS